MRDSDAELLAREFLQTQPQGAVPAPFLLRYYKNIDNTLPALVIKSLDAQLTHEYRYALCGQIVAAMALLLMAGGFIYLVLHEQERPAYALLGAGVLNAIGGFLRARLRANEESTKAVATPSNRISTE